jgi:hypothetical protein
MFRGAAKVDRTHREVVSALRSLGCSVQSLAAVGGGVPDLLVGFSGRAYLVEVKDGSAAPSARRLTPAQAQWREAWRGPWALVLGAEDVPDLVSQWRRESQTCEIASGKK